MSVYLSAAIARRAEQVQADHGPDETGLWCGCCLRRHRVRVCAGECGPFLRAAGFIAAWQAQKRPRPPRSASPARVRAWSRD